MILFNPGAAIGLSLLFGFAIVPIIVLLSHGALRINSAKQRFLAAVGFCVFSWFIGVVMMAMTGTLIIWYDILAGLMILMTAIIAFGILWSLVCWGFTISLLSALCAINGSASRDDWFFAYGGGSSIADFADDRLSILLGLGIAETDGKSVKLSCRVGLFIASTVRVLRRFYGLIDV